MVIKWDQTYLTLHRNMNVVSQKIVVYNDGIYNHWLYTLKNLASCYRNVFLATPSPKANSLTTPHPWSCQMAAQQWKTSVWRFTKTSSKSSSSKWLNHSASWAIYHWTHQRTQWQTLIHFCLLFKFCIKRNAGWKHFTKQVCAHTKKKPVFYFWSSLPIFRHRPGCLKDNIFYPQKIICLFWAQKIS